MCVVQIHMSHGHVIWQTVGVYCEAVVVASDLNGPIRQAFNWVVGTTVAKLQLKGLGAKGEARI